MANDTDHRRAEVGQGTERPLARGALLRLLAPLFAGNLALFSTYLGVAAVFLPTQVAKISSDPVTRALDLSVVTGAAAVVSLVAQPVFGTLSDRSRRRNPWILGFGVAAAAGMLWVGDRGTMPLLVASWCAVTVLLNGYQVVLTAVVPDRVPRGQRGVASAAVGAATPLAAVAGVTTAGRFVGDVPLGYATFGIGLALSAVVFVAASREPSLPRTESASRAGQWRSMASALRQRDFLFAFVSRAAVMMAYDIVFLYLLFIVDARVGLPAGWSPVTAITVLSAVAATAMVVGTVAGGLLADRLRRYRGFVVVAAAVMSVAAIPPVFSASFTAMVVYVSVMGLGFGGFLAVDTAIVTFVLPRAEDAARDMGVLNVANTVPQTLAAFLAGLIVAALGGGPGSYAALFVVSIAFAVTGGFAILGVRGVR